MSVKKYIWIFVIIILVAGAAFLAFRNKKSAEPAASYQISNIQTQSIEPSASPKSTPISTPMLTTPAQSAGSSGQITNGTTRGQIVCDYVSPAAPGTFGTANIESNWNNLVYGKNGKAEAEVCVNGSKMSINNSANGSMTNPAPWISLDAGYTFTLYDEHGGDLPDCSGVELSVCSINQVSPPTPNPNAPSGGFSGH